MKHQILEAMGEMDDRFILESASQQLKRTWISWASIAVACLVLLAGLLFWPAGNTGEGEQIVALPGVMKVYACEIDSTTEEDLEKYAITDKREGFFATIHLPAASATFRMPISFVISENYWGESEITFRTVSAYEGFLENLTIANGECIIINSRAIAEPVYAVCDQVGINGEFYVDFLIYANEEVVGYGVLSFCFVDGNCYAYEFYTECFPMIDGKMQEITMDNIQERIRTYKQAKVPGEGSEYVRETLEYWNAQER